MKSKDPSVHEIQQEIMSFLKNWSFFQRSNAPSANILSLFIFNPKLNQEEIKSLSGLSVAKVYKELKRLIYLGVVSKNRDKSTNQVFYTMDRIDIALIELIANNSQKLADWGPKFKKMRRELRSKKSEYSKLTGYSIIVSWTNLFSQLTKTYERVYKYLINSKKMLLTTEKG